MHEKMWDTVLNVGWCVSFLYRVIRKSKCKFCLVKLGKYSVESKSPHFLCRNSSRQGLAEVTGVQTPGSPWLFLCVYICIITIAVCASLIYILCCCVLKTDSRDRKERGMFFCFFLWPKNFPSFFFHSLDSWRFSFAETLFKRHEVPSSTHTLTR